MIWLGLNDGITEGTYVKDNTKNPVIYIDYFNWDQAAGANTDEISSVKYSYSSQTWFRYASEGTYAHAVCTKDPAGRSRSESKTCDVGDCDEGWCQIEDTCYKLLDGIDQKNNNLWEYLHLINFEGEGDGRGDVWLGLNDGITEGTYVKDNTKNPVIYIDWFNWDQAAGENTDEMSSVKFDFNSKTWFRYSAEDFANAVCTKPV